MADGSNIEWTDATWNPVVGCAKVAQGCKHCYAEAMAKRLARMGQDHYAAVVNDTGWNGRAVTVPEALSKPLRWKKPRRIFVNSMSDLYHEDVPFEFIAAVYGVMAACPQHLFIILTKRPKRMREFFGWVSPAVPGANADTARKCAKYAVGCIDGIAHLHRFRDASQQVWPLPNVIHGYSASTQADLDAGIGDLLATPSARRCLSLEPLIGPIKVEPYLGNEVIAYGEAGKRGATDFEVKPPRLHWILVGGESGPGARRCDIAWIHSIVAQCKAAGVPAFVKQLGAHVTTNFYDDATQQSWEEHGREWPMPDDWDGIHQPCTDEMVRLTLTDPKGGDPSEWPADLRVRQFPEARQ